MLFGLPHNRKKKKPTLTNLEHKGEGKSPDVIIKATV